MYEPEIPFRWHIRSRDAWVQDRSGIPKAGGRSRKVTEHYKVLQWWNDDLEQWVDVPEVRDGD